MTFLLVFDLLLAAVFASLSNNVGRLHSFGVFLLHHLRPETRETSTILKEFSENEHFLPRRDSMRR